jgi:hypothetical protein
MFSEIIVCVSDSSGRDGEIHCHSSTGDPKSGTSTGSDVPYSFPNWVYPRPTSGTATPGTVPHDAHARHFAVSRIFFFFFFFEDDSYISRDEHERCTRIGCGTGPESP